MPIDLSIVGEAIPVLLKGLRITALVSLAAVSYTHLTLPTKA